MRDLSYNRDNLNSNISFDQSKYLKSNSVVMINSLSLTYRYFDIKKIKKKPLFMTDI